LVRKGYAILWAREMNGEELILSMLEPYAVSQYTFFSAKDVEETATLIGLTDFIVADKGRASQDIQLPGRSFFANSKMAPLEIF
jgi:hypothetical protein